MFDSVSFDGAIDTVALTIPGVDYGTDMAVLIQAMIYLDCLPLNMCGLFPSTSDDCSECFDWNLGNQPPSWFLGLVLFVLAHYLRCVTECASFLAYRQVVLDFWPILLCFAVGWLFGVVIVLERVTKLLLAPLEPIFSSGFCAGIRGSSQVEEHRLFVADHLFLFTKHERPFIRSRRFPQKYLHMMASVGDGGRWVAFLLASDASNHGGHIRSFKIIHTVAIMEEVVENIGGILMSVSLLGTPAGEASGGSTLAYTSIGIAIVSLVFETGYLFGKRQSGFRQDQRRDEEGDVKTEAETAV